MVFLQPFGVVFAAVQQSYKFQEYRGDSIFVHGQAIHQDGAKLAGLCC